MNRCFLCLKEEESIDCIPFLVTEQLFYGIFCSPFLVCLGAPLFQLEGRFLDGKVFLRAKKGKRHGLLLYAFSGLFRRKETAGHLKMRGGRFKGSNSLYFVIFGRGASCM